VKTSEKTQQYDNFSHMGSHNSAADHYELRPAMWFHLLYRFNQTTRELLKIL
jgi:hypothetical protein